MNTNAQTQLIQTPSGMLEAVEEKPKNMTCGVSKGTVILSHPHPLHGGTMDNKVVQTMGRAFAYAGWTVVRFNFRGVGKSEGQFDDGIGETEDLLNVISHFAPDGLISLGGFSFGASMTCRAIQRLQKTRDIKKIVLIGLAASRFEAPAIDPDYHLDTLVIHGQEDETVELKHVMSWANEQIMPVTVVPKTGHFFHGQLPLLKGLIMRHVNSSGF